MRRAVLVDLFNTLVPGGSDGLRHSVLTRMAGILGVDPHAYVRAFADTWPERFIGATGDLHTTVRMLARRVGGDPSGQQVAAAAALRRGMTAGLLAAAPPGTLATLDKLRADDWPLGLVSNTTSESPDGFRRSRLAGRFDAAVFSSELGVRKPDPAIFLAACEQLRVAPPACVYVGDGADDELAAAASLGMRAIRTIEHADSVPGWSGPTIGTLVELPDLLT